MRRGGLDEFGDALHPDVRAAIRSWDEPGHPLERLHAALAAHANRKSFLDSCAEAMVARHVLARACTLRFEVPTPSGKACDFEVTDGDARFFLHVKRFDSDHPSRRHLTISSRLRSLERVERPYVVSVRWHEGATDRQMQRLVRSAGDFIVHAHVGDELVVHDDDGSEIGGVLVVAPWAGTHVSLVIGLPTGFIDEAPRLRRLLGRAHRQFMPRASNVILVCSSHEEGRADFESALLGAHVERWDTFPPRNRRIAHGRAADGFWHGHRHLQSRAAGWFPFRPDRADLDVHLQFRAGTEIPPPVRASLDRLFPSPGFVSPVD